MSTPDNVPLTENEMRARLDSSERRLAELLNLNGGDLPGADAQLRLQLIQEFFFHLVGAIDVLAQLVNEQSAGSKGYKGSEYVYVPDVAKNLPKGDARQSILASLHANPRKDPMPTDPYSEEGYIYRIYNYRNQITHRHKNPLHFTYPARETFLLLDPRDAEKGTSAKLARAEFQFMLELVRDKCEKVLAHM